MILRLFSTSGRVLALMTFVPLFRCYNRALNLAIERPRTNRRIYFLVRQDTSAMRLYVDLARLVYGHGLHTKEDVLAYKQHAMDEIDRFIKERQKARNAVKRALPAGACAVNFAPASRRTLYRDVCALILAVLLPAVTAAHWPMFYSVL